MKTKVKNLGIAFVLSILVSSALASELKSKSIFDRIVEPAIELEKWMLEEEIFTPKFFDTGGSTVVEIAVSNPDFSILVEAVTKANLAAALSADGPFTVFAPNNDAFNLLFDKLGVEGIGDLSKEQLTPILTYHVVSGKLMSSDLTETSVSTLNGKQIKIDLSKGVQINESKVIAADISGNNGVIHVIDKVLIPE